MASAFQKKNYLRKPPGKYQSEEFHSTGSTNEKTFPHDYTNARFGANRLPGKNKHPDK
jgi:hypothetical protein